MEKLTAKIETMTLGAAAPAKKPAGSMGQSTEIQTNAVRLELKKNLVIYKYDINIEMVFSKTDGTEAKKSLTRGPKNDSEYLGRVEKAQLALRTTVDENRAIFGNVKLYYDNQANIYTFSKLGNLNVFNIQPDIITKNEQCIRVDVTITPVADSFQVSSNDIANTVNPVFGKEDRTLLEALNVLVNGEAYQREDMVSYGNVHYLYCAQDAGFAPSDTPNLKGDQYMGVGSSEAVKTLEGPDGKKAFYTVTEVKKSAFHVDNTTLENKFLQVLPQGRFRPDLAANSLEAKQLLNKLKGLVCRLNYGENRGRGKEAKTITIGGFSLPAADIKFADKDGKNHTVQSYFQTKFNIRLKYPKLFTVYDAKKKDVRYPVEVLYVADSQRVKTHQILETKPVVDASAVAPEIRLKQTKALANHLGLNASNVSMRDVGIIFDKDQAKVKGRLLPVPTLTCGAAPADKIEVENRSTWKINRYVAPVKFPKWKVISINVQYDVKNLIGELKKKGQRFGMGWTEPEVKIIGNYQRGSLQQEFIEAKKAGVAFLFFVIEKRTGDELHGELKALEQKYDVLTQHVKDDKARDYSKGQTIANIVHKMNEKLGGLNWKVSHVPASGLKVNIDAGMMFFGFETSRTTGGDDPICVGYSANASKNLQKYIGGYRYAEKGSDVYGQILKDVLNEMCGKFVSSHGKPPNYLYFYFNGISEGQFALIANDYVKTIKEFISSKQNWRPNITIWATSKTHNERFFKTQISGKNCAEKNITPGTVVDSCIVSPVLNEFYLNAHSAIKGTAKTPKFSLIYDSNNWSMDEHEAIAYKLSFLHDIVASPTSLPVPILVADRMAKRGNNNFIQKKLTGSVSSGNSECSAARLNEELTYVGKGLSNTRFNA